MKLFGTLRRAGFQEGLFPPPGIWKVNLCCTRYGPVKVHDKCHAYNRPRGLNSEVPSMNLCLVKTSSLVPQRRIRETVCFKKAQCDLMYGLVPTALHSSRAATKPSVEKQHCRDTVKMLHSPLHPRVDESDLAFESHVGPAVACTPSTLHSHPQHHINAQCTSLQPHIYLQHRPLNNETGNLGDSEKARRSLSGSDV